MFSITHNYKFFIVSYIYLCKVYAQKEKKLKHQPNEETEIINTIIDPKKDMDALRRLDRDEFVNQTLDHLQTDKQCKIR